jgi:hypothetical protein
MIKAIGDCNNNIKRINAEIKLADEIKEDQRFKLKDLEK